MVSSMKEVGESCTAESGLKKYPAPCADENPKNQDSYMISINF